MNVEELIAKIAKEHTENPICWLVSYEDRPLQAEPSTGAGPHLLVFSAAEKANRFIELRKAHYHSETLKALTVDTAGNLKKLATTKADDPDYEAPPCGLMLDFDYASGTTAKNLAATQMSELGAKEISAELKPAVKEIPAVPMVVPVPIPTPEIPKTKAEGKGKKSTAIPNPPPLPMAPVAAAAGMSAVQPTVQQSPAAIISSGPHGWIRQGKTLTEKMLEKKEKVTGGEGKRTVQYTQLINLADLVNHEAGTFSMYVVDGVAHILAKIAPPPDDVKATVKKNIKSGTMIFKVTQFPYPSFPVMYCRMVIPMEPEIKTGTHKGTMVEATTNFTEANFQEWVSVVEKTHSSKVVVYLDGGVVFGEGKKEFTTESIMFLVQEVENANQALKKIPAGNRDFNTACNQFFKDHPEPFLDAPVKTETKTEPKPSAKPVVAPPLPVAVKEPLFVGKRTNPAGTYEDYIGTDAESAKKFLLTKKVTEGRYYIAVKTPEGNWGMDKEGLYMEGLLPWQTNISATTVEGSHDFSQSIFSVMAAKKGMSDNFVTGVTCGKCGHKWQDGVRYQNTTVVKCPECKTLNKVDTTNVHVFG